MEFDAVKPVQDDYHGVRCLLKQLVRKANVDLSGLSDLILAQPVSTVVKIMEDGQDQEAVSKKEEAAKKPAKPAAAAAGAGVAEDAEEEEEEGPAEDKDSIYAVMSCFDLQDSKRPACVQGLLSYFLSNCADKEKRAAIESVLSKQRAVFLINERFINMPTQLAVPLLQTLQQDLEAQAGHAPQYYFMVCKAYIAHDDSDDEDEDGNSGKKRKQPAHPRKRYKPAPREDLTYTNDEDEMFVGAAEHSFTFALPAEEGDTKMKLFRTVALVSAAAFGETVAALQAALNPTYTRFQ